MAGYLNWVTTNFSNLLWGGPQEMTASPETLEEVFVKNISDLSEYSSSPEQDKLYIDDCIRAFDKYASDFNWTSPQTMQKPLQEALDTFDYVVERSVYDSDAKRIKSEFRQGCAELIKEKWSTGQVQKFYRIMLLSNPKEWIGAAQEWTQQFVTEASSLQQLANDLSLPEDLCSFDSLATSSLNAFETYYGKTVQQKTESLTKALEHNLGSLDQKIISIKTKAKEDPLSLSAEEMEIIDCLTDSPNPQQDGPKSAVLEAKKTILNKCLLLGNSLYSNSDSVEDQESQKAFEQLFAEFDCSLAERLAEKKL